MTSESETSNWHNTLCVVVVIAVANKSHIIGAGVDSASLQTKPLIFGTHHSGYSYVEILLVTVSTPVSVPASFLYLNINHLGAHSVVAQQYFGSRKDKWRRNHIVLDLNN
jgi:hypothetical protein